MWLFVLSELKVTNWGTNRGCRQFLLLAGFVQVEDASFESIFNMESHNYNIATRKANVQSYQHHLKSELQLELL